MTAFDPAPVLSAAGDAVRNGKVDDALAMLDTAIADHVDAPLLHGFAGLIACGAGRLAEGIAHLRRALALQPDDAATRRNLVRALLDSGAPDEAEAIGTAGDQADPKLRRLLGYLRQARGDDEAAAADYAAVVAAFPGDGPSWNNLANAQAALKRTDRAVESFRRAVAIIPDDPAIRINAAQALAGAERREEQLRWTTEAAARFAGNADIRFELALARAATRDLGGAEAALRETIALDPTHVDARLELGLLLENLNRLDELDAVIAAGETAGIDPARLIFLRALALRRRGAFAEAMPLAEAVPDTIDPIRRHQLLGEIADRLGDPDRAFEEFVRMNAATAAIVPDALMTDAARYLGEIAADTRSIPAIAARRDRTGGPRPSPVFIVGFPRSGTTLLDTLLMNVPDLHVTEELPMMVAVEQAVGDRDLATLDDAAIERLRDVYFAQLEALSPPPPGATVVDKHPLHMARMGLIHRLFPDAKILFAERHPCDVLLSCFLSNFQPNSAMVHFLTLEGAATLYDTVFEAWSAACAHLPLDVHEVRYERVVADTPAELKALIAFLGRDWDDGIVDNQASAAKRTHIRTASYAQVTEPIYTRSAGRWRRYERHLAPVLPVLARWAERMGYPI